ncbi:MULTISPECIES: URC4/urg3 family protein [unclassified Bradyrhizobium]|uniref:URC4/urg3 family protein n=1 Tax=unclassified Bradyrhizobium TaxID=2631580 RepID=UPI0028E7D5EC|nr:MULTISPECIES: URC4/urg3 family protein [unclassified Bradyrhizobium]
MDDVAYLLSARAVRERAHQMLVLGLADKLPHFRVEVGKLDAIADLVLDVTRKAYPDGEVPFHSRWRHFVVGGVDRWAAIADKVNWPNAASRARAEFDLAITSVLLDAGAGAAWRYHDVISDTRIGRSEGLALASLDMFASGAFSADASDPLRADAAKLKQLTVGDLERGFQVGADNPLVGLEGRVELLRRLGVVVNPHSDRSIFPNRDTPRPGGLFDDLAARAEDGRIQADAILQSVLRQFGRIWPSRILLNGTSLGDCWRHPSLPTDDGISNLVPLHKLSQWLSYSLIEPLQRAGLVVENIDGLTGLAEYRNGGLFVDGGVLVLRDPADAARAHAVDSPLVVEWRALTVALLDRLALLIRQRTGQTAEQLPLARILEGGSWAAGRKLAFARRPDGSPPLTIISDGTVF